MATTHPAHPIHAVHHVGQGVDRAPVFAQAAPEGAMAMARLLVVSLAWGAASVPAFVAGSDSAGWCMAIMALALMVRFPMAGVCSVLGGGAFLAATLAGVAFPNALGPAGIVSEDLWMQASAWLTVVAALASIGLLDPRTFQHTFRREGRPVARWNSTAR